MTYFLKSGTSYNVTNRESMDLHEKLPAGTYVIKKNPMTDQLYLESIESFEIKGKIYGDTIQTANRIINTFNVRSASTGVMLAGEKGSGKTLLAKMLAVISAEQDIPTIVINTPWKGDKFNSFLQMIEQPCVILFDEFEKVYDSEDQEEILTLLDGVFPSKKLFVLTCNNKWRIDSHMRNRPGRIFYMLDFTGLNQDFIIEYCNDNLINTQYIDQICKIAMMFDQYNFDMLKALIEEMNRYNETPQESMRMLNARPEFAGESKYTVIMRVDGNVITQDQLQNREWVGNPLQKSVYIEYNLPSDDPEEAFEWFTARFEQHDLKKIDSQAGKFVYTNQDGDNLSLTKVVNKQFMYYDAF